MRALDFQKFPAKKAILSTGLQVSLLHISGTPTWGGPDGQTPGYNSGTATAYCRAVPVKEEIKLGEQIYGASDLHAWFPWDTTISLGDQVLFSGTALDGNYQVGTLMQNDTVVEAYLSRLTDP